MGSSVVYSVSFTQLWPTVFSQLIEKQFWASFNKWYCFQLVVEQWISTEPNICMDPRWSTLKALRLCQRLNNATKYINLKDRIKHDANLSFPYSKAVHWDFYKAFKAEIWHEDSMWSSPKNDPGISTHKKLKKRPTSGAFTLMPSSSGYFLKVQIQLWGEVSSLLNGCVDPGFTQDSPDTCPPLCWSSGRL